MTDTNQRARATSAAASTGANARDAVRRTKAGYLSADGKSQIKALVWEPAGTGGVTPRGIVQIVHGMAEYVGRYDGFASFLAARGFVVCANDHIGHGKSASAEEDLGHMPLRGGKDVLIADVHELRRTVAARFARQTPYVLFGHSMGSFITRAYLARHADGLAAAVLCGTGQQPFLLSKAGNLAARAIGAVRGERYRSAFLDGLGAGAFGKQIEDARTPLDWISTDPAVVEAYLADELCGQMFTVGGYATLTDLTGEVVTAACAERVPKDLPVLFVAGAEDPVGACGEGVRRAVEQFRRAGVREVDCTIYPGMRHEILNEPGRAEVYEDVATWIEAHTAR